MIFARVEIDGFKACGVFLDAEDASEMLFDAAYMAGVSESPKSALYSHKPGEDMTDADRLEIGSQAVGAVVVL